MNPPDLKDSFYPFLSVFVLFMILCIIVTEKCRNAQCYYGGDLICKDMHVVLPVPPCEMTFTPLGFLDAFSGAIWRFLIFNAVIDVRCGVDLTEPNWISWLASYLNDKSVRNKSFCHLLYPLPPACKVAGANPGCHCVKAGGHIGEEASPSQGHIQRQT